MLGYFCGCVERCCGYVLSIHQLSSFIIRHLFLRQRTLGLGDTYTKFVICQPLNHPISIQHYNSLSSNTLGEAKKDSGRLGETGSGEPHNLLSRLWKGFIMACG